MKGDRMRKLTFTFLSFMILFWGCSEEILPPSENVYGITGLIYDQNGIPVDGVKIYYLFNYIDIPIYNSSERPIGIDSVNEFENKLYQNFSNPVYNSTFLRFSLDSEMDLKFELKEKKSSKIVHSFAGRYNYGLYQHYFDRLVDSLDLENGMYVMDLETSNNGIVTFKSQKTLVVVSDIGKPNSISDNYGKYLYSYNDAFIGDTINFTLDGEDIYPQEITNSIYLLFKKDGYYSRSVAYELFPNMLLNQDIILYKEITR